MTYKVTTFYPKPKITLMPSKALNDITSQTEAYVNEFSKDGWKLVSVLPGGMGWVFFWEKTGK